MSARGLLHLLQVRSAVAGVAGTLALAGNGALGQTGVPASAPSAPAAVARPAKPAAGAAPVKPTAPAKAAGPARPVTPPADSPPTWASLNGSQQAALRPLAPIWSQITPGRKRKWIALSANYGRLSPAEQDILHGRMTEWAMLSAAERNRARLNFAETRNLSSQEKKAQWEAYQALTPTQKQQLAGQAAKAPTTGAAPAVTSRGRGKLASVPVTRPEKGSGRAAVPMAPAPAAPAAAGTMPPPAAMPGAALAASEPASTAAATGSAAMVSP